MWYIKYNTKNYYIRYRNIYKCHIEKENREKDGIKNIENVMIMKNIIIWKYYNYIEKILISKKTVN